MKMLIVTVMALNMYIEVLSNKGDSDVDGCDTDGDDDEECNNECDDDDDDASSTS